MAYKLSSKDSRWQYVDSSVITGGLGLEALCNDEKSTFYRLASGDSTFEYIEDKQICEHYVSDRRDAQCHNVGSLICCSLSVPSPYGETATLILSIASYGQCFCSTPDAQAIEITKMNLRDLVVPHFSDRIRIELAYLAIKKYFEPDKACSA
jgi:hypothetical protein